MDTAGRTIAMAAEPADRRWALWGGAAGLLLGGTDWLLFELLGVSIELGGRDVAAITFAFFAATYGLLGYLFGRVLEARARLRRDAVTIKSQLESLRESQARVLHYEKLASIGRLAAGVAHEVRNSIGVVRSAAGLLLEDLDAAGAVDAEQRKAGRFIREEIDRLDGFVRSLLDFSRPLHAGAASVDVTGVLEHVRNVVATAHGDGSLAVEIDVAQDATTWSADRDLLTQLLLAIALNAGDWAERLRLRAVRQDTELVIDVADDGPGIPAGDEERVFEPFFSTKGSGTGLGLAMARRIADAHSGKLTVVGGAGLGSDGGGACFRLTLPQGARRSEDAA